MNGKFLCLVFIFLLLFAQAGSAGVVEDIGSAWGDVVKSVQGFRLPAFSIAPTCGGFTTLSATTTNVISTDEDVASNNLKVLITPNCVGAGASGTLAKGALSSLSGLGIGEDVVITLDSSKDSWVYNIVNDGTLIWKYQNLPASEYWTFNPPANHCTYADAQGTDTQTCKSGTTLYGCGSQNCYGCGCYGVSQVATKGHLYSPQPVYTANFKMTIGDQSINKTLTSADYMVDFGGLGSATFLGGLLVGNPPPSTDYVAIYNKNLGQWKLALTEDWQQYQSSYYIAKSAVLGVYNTFQTQVSEEGATVDKLLTSSVSIGDSTLQQSGLETSSLVYYPKTKITNQQILLSLPLSALKVIIPTGVPKIISVSATTLAAGEDGTITAVVKNNGTVSAGFTLEVSGCSPIQMKLASQPFTLTAGKETSVSIPVIWQSTTVSTSETTKSCAISLCDSHTGKCATKSVSVVATPSKICVPDQYFIDPGKFYELNQCSSDGLSINYGVLTCSQTATQTYQYESVTTTSEVPIYNPIIYQNGKYTCQYVIQPENCSSGDTYTDESSCQYACDTNGSTALKLVSCGETSTLWGGTAIPTVVQPKITGTAVKTAAGISPPGFEAIFAIAGLLAVAYLVIRRKDAG